MEALINIEETIQKLTNIRDLNIKCLEETESAILKPVRNELIAHVSKLEQDIINTLSTLMVEN